MDFLSNLTFGKSRQDIVIKYLEKRYRYKFLAGERNGEVENIKFIEEIEHCEFIPEDRTHFPAHGNLLKFINYRTVNLDILTMPDFLMESKENKQKLYWIEVKAHMKSSGKLIIDADNFDDYELLYNHYTRCNIYVICVDIVNNNQNIVDFYFCNIQKLIDNKPEKQWMSDKWKYIWDIDDNMELLNKKDHIQLK